MKSADWYFDFISPFSYLQLEAFDRQPPGVEVTFRPVLFAALLGHWGHKGPAEIQRSGVSPTGSRNGVPSATVFR
ncbi:MAG: hypothetical protein QOD95_2937 [Gammaproteobacteria bacterium]|jgi:2-hydroxychromene-2-carboxylate isomerase|nr:hypothetical protein [Gammaproteobacteria bacterium]